MTTDWEPTADDITWMVQHIQMLSDDGVWVIPANGSIYTISHTKKTFNFYGVNDETDKRVHKVLNQLGYKFKEGKKYGSRVIQPQ